MASTYVVDKSAMRDQGVLRPFLLESPNNRVLLTDFCCMESYKGIAERNLPKSLRVLEDFPTQVGVLRGTREIVRLSLESATKPADFIDPVQTREFPDFCRLVRQALEGNDGLHRQILAHAAQASGFFAVAIREAKDIMPAIREITRELPQQTVKRLRREEEPTIDDIRIFIAGMLSLTHQFYLTHPDRLQLPDATVLPRTFILRYAVAGYLLALDWIRRGGIEQVSLEKLANDVTDMNYVAFATYFDGILTKDVKLASIYAEARWYICDVLEGATNQKPS